jgi:hypothetical protein
VLIYYGKCLEREDLHPLPFREYPVGARVYGGIQIVALEQIS